MKTADFPFSIKSLDDAGSIEGVLAGFGDADLGGDRLLPGCLSKSLASRSGPLPMLLCHDLSRPIGAWREWEERDSCLHVRGRMTLACRDAQEAHALARDGGLTGLSIGWMPRKATIGDDGTRLVAEAELFEGSLVPVPMNPRARVTALKDFTSPRDIAEALQEAGMTSRKAKLIGGAGWKLINPDAEALEEIERLFDEHSAKLAALEGQ